MKVARMRGAAGSAAVKRAGMAEAVAAAKARRIGERAGNKGNKKPASSTILPPDRDFPAGTWMSSAGRAADYSRVKGGPSGRTATHWRDPAGARPALQGDGPVTPTSSLHPKAADAEGARRGFSPQVSWSRRRRRRPQDGSPSATSEVIIGTMYAKWISRGLSPVLIHHWAKSCWNKSPVRFWHHRSLA